ncbi:hypothetical protein O0V02_09240 [Gordonia amicalis]|uniref:hypothetical protein n=1 Tax=Gordonia amicalis TaxID=89053 RepID=UPI0022A6E4D2|nr:hypothetical protein [Gordonia amicalis]MCZ0912592.1 hypothetical protein [Gordonia amicalis]
MTAPARLKPTPRTPEYLLKPGTPVDEYEIFLSSGSDLDEYRDLFEGLADVFSKQAFDGGAPYRIRVRRWEGAVSRKTFGDGNREFRYDAENAHLVVVLLREDLRKGTREELEAAVAASDTQVVILWIDPPDRKRTRKRASLALFKALDELREDVRWNAVSSDADNEVVLAMTAVLARVLVDISSRTGSMEGYYSETR